MHVALACKVVEKILERLGKLVEELAVCRLPWNALPFEPTDKSASGSGVSRSEILGRERDVGSHVPPAVTKAILDCLREDHSLLSAFNDGTAGSSRGSTEGHPDTHRPTPRMHPESQNKKPPPRPRRRPEESRKPPWRNCTSRHHHGEHRGKQWNTEGAQAGHKRGGGIWGTEGHRDAQRRTEGHRWTQSGTEAHTVTQVGHRGGTWEERTRKASHLERIMGLREPDVLQQAAASRCA